jgi:hypothetical protein
LNTYRIGETVTCKCTVLRSGAVYDPATSVLIYVYIKGTTAPLVDGVAMSKEETGIYTYNFQTASQAAGKYRWTCKATDGTKIAMEDDSFEVVA